MSNVSSSSTTVQALVRLGKSLRQEGYSFITITPESHRRVLSRDRRLATSLRDVFGWSRPFERNLLEAPMLEALTEAKAIAETPDGWKSSVRFSTLGSDLFVHSAYPTVEGDAVFFGPDTYRFCAAIQRTRRIPHGRVIDVGCGSGAGGLHARHDAKSIVLTDVNETALQYALVNAHLASQAVEVFTSDVFANVSGQFDFIIANPPYMRDSSERTYRDGGEQYGAELSIRIAREAIGRLSADGTLLLYTGAVVVNGEDQFLRGVRPLFESARMSFEYEELDPDVFGEELSNPAYARAERIAAIALTARRSPHP